MRIHHATAEKAAKLGIALEIEDDVVVARDGPREARGANPRLVLDALLAARNAPEPKTTAPAPEPEPEPETKPGPRKGSVVPRDARLRYARHNGCNGDAIALALREACKTATLHEIAAANGVMDLPARYGRLNNGLRRMTLGNLLRALHRKGQSLKIGDVVIAGNSND